MRERGKIEPSLAGSLLLAHPSMRDENFRRAVVLLSAHSDEGALGVILNRPLGKQLGDLKVDFATGPLAAVPVYLGGPVSPTQVILAAWQTLSEEGAFKLYFGVDVDKLEELLGEADLQVRAFLGYSGWSKGQLEDELRQDAWLISSVPGEMLGQLEGPDLWRTILGGISPEMRLEADEPENPEKN